MHDQDAFPAIATRFSQREILTPGTSSPMYLASNALFEKAKTSAECLGTCPSLRRNTPQPLCASASFFVLRELQARTDSMLTRSKFRKEPLRRKTDKPLKSGPECNAKQSKTRKCNFVRDNFRSSKEGLKERNSQTRMTGEYSQPSGVQTENLKRAKSGLDLFFSSAPFHARHFFALLHLSTCLLSMHLLSDGSIILVCL